MDARRDKIAKRLASKLAERRPQQDPQQEPYLQRITPELVKSFDELIPQKVSGKLTSILKIMSSRAKISFFIRNQVALLLLKSSLKKVGRQNLRQLRVQFSASNANKNE